MTRRLCLRSLLAVATTGLSSDGHSSSRARIF